jgi:1-phosphofructokinase family hexose kinase
VKVLCITPNTAVDRTLRVAGFQAGRVWRAEGAGACIGGKGINVARALLRLGQEPVCAGLLGGHSGVFAAEDAARDGIEGDWTWIEGETRTCVIVVGDRGESTVINEPGPVLAAADWERLVVDAGRLARGVAAVAISGSLPRGCPPAALSALVTACARGGRTPVWVDTSGAPLEDAVAASPYGIKINAEEAAALLGWRVQSWHDAIRAARAIRDRGPARVAITLGGGGAVIATGRGDWRARPAAIAAVSAVGSGDCFLAGLISGFAEAVSAAEALRLATACGTANALKGEIGAFDTDDLSRLMAGAEVSLITG